MKKTILLILSIQSIFPQNPIMIPDTLSGNLFNLTLQNGTYSFYDDRVTQTMGINGNILGPTLIMNQGENVDINVHNQLNDTTTIHWHGMHVSSINDGGPHTTIAPGITWNPHFTVMDKAGTYWYHPHLHENTDLHVSKGIAGFVIVRDDEEGQLNLPRTYGVDDFPLAIQTKAFDSNREIVVPSNADSVLLLNATRNAQLNVPAQIVRFRLLDGSSQRVFNIGLEDDRIFYHIASDGGLLEEPIELTRLRMAPAERNEILIDFTGMEGQSVNLMSYASELENGIYGAAIPGMMANQTLNGYNPNPLNGTDFTILQFNVIEQTNSPIVTIPTSLATLNPLIEDEADTTRTFLLSALNMGMNVLNGEFVINGDPFAMDIINETVMLNNIEIWSLTNQSPIAHPFHIHGVQFYILDRDGIPPSPSESGRKDVVLINAMSTVRIITKFSDYADDEIPYMYHCHMLHHEDGGMMGQFLVVDTTTTVGIKNEFTSPSTFELLQPYPNPFNPTTSISFSIDSQSAISLKILDLNGRIVYDLLHEIMPAGDHELIWNSEYHPSGVYFVVLQSGSKVQTKKLILLK